MKTLNDHSTAHSTHYCGTISLCIASLVIMHHFCTLILSWSSRAYIYFPKAPERMISYWRKKGVGITQWLGLIVLNPYSVSWENVLRRCAVQWEMWWKGIIWPPTTSSWKVILRVACLSGLITISLLKIPSFSLLQSFMMGSRHQKVFAWGK